VVLVCDTEKAYMPGAKERESKEPAMMTPGHREGPRDYGNGGDKRPDLWGRSNYSLQANVSSWMNLAEHDALSWHVLICEDGPEVLDPEQ
jgi:hypothetical protein